MEILRLLSLPKKSTYETVFAAYKKRLLELHPDKGNTENIDIGKITRAWRKYKNKYSPTVEKVSPTELELNDDIF